MAEGAVVVRGGILGDLSKVLERAQFDYDEGEEAHLGVGLTVSVVCDTPADAESWSDFLCRVAQEGMIRNNKVRTVALETLLGHTFNVVADPPPPNHHLIDLGIDAPREKLALLNILLGPPEENPCPAQ